MEATLLPPRKEDFTKSFRENGKALMVHKGCNRAGRFLEATIFAEGGQRRGIWFPEGREGWCWQHNVGELQKFLGFLATEERPMVSSVNSSGDFSSRDRSYAIELFSSTGGLKSQPKFNLNLYPMVSLGLTILTRSDNPTQTRHEISEFGFTLNRFLRPVYLV